jgi:CYTH domain-containing protein
MLEIERKFLVIADSFKTVAANKKHIAQGYISSHPERTVRIRIKGESGYLTIKGKSNEKGTTRFEWETELPLSEAKPLLDLCEGGRIEKIRWEVIVGKHLFEVDEFLGENSGLIIAEVELADENEIIEIPEWIGVEVTGDVRYYNSHLSQSPFTTW